MAGKMRFIGNYEVNIPGKGVFAKGWEGPADPQLLKEKSHLFEEIKKKVKPETEQPKDGE